MPIKQEAIECLKKSFKDVRCLNAYLKLEELFFRTLSDGTTESRFLSLDRKEITDIDALLDLVSLEDSSFRYVECLGNRGSNSNIQVQITMLNAVFNVYKNKNPEDDVVYGRYRAGARHPVFILTYLGDNDQDLKLKVVDITSDAVSAEILES